MPLIDLVDDTFLAVTPQRVAEQVHDPRRWALWWPDLELVTSRDRGAKGRQWVARTTSGAPRMVGTAEIWLEPWGDGVLVHHYLRLDPVDADGGHGGDSGRGAVGRRRADRQRRRRAIAWKLAVHRLKDELEAQARS